MGIWDDFVSKVEGAADDVADWWYSSEDEETKPKTYLEQAQNERLAEGSAIPVVQSAQDADGKTIISVPEVPFSAYKPYLIGGGVLIVVLFVFALLMRGGR